MLLAFCAVVAGLMVATCYLPQVMWGCIVAKYARRFHTDETGFPT